MININFSIDELELLFKGIFEYDEFLNNIDKEIQLKIKNFLIDHSSYDTDNLREGYFFSEKDNKVYYHYTSGVSEREIIHKFINYKNLIVKTFYKDNLSLYFFVHDLKYLGNKPIEELIKEFF